MFHKTKACDGLEHKGKVVHHTYVEKQLYSSISQNEVYGNIYPNNLGGGFMLNLWGQAGKSAFKQAAQGLLSLT